jgi:hypothetical protein
VHDDRRGKEGTHAVLVLFDILPSGRRCGYVGPMNHVPKNQDLPSKRVRSVPTVSTILPDGSIVEIVYSEHPLQTALVVWKDGRWTSEASIDIGDSKRLVPYSPTNNLIANQVVLLASAPEEYGLHSDLVREIEAFIHSYVDVTPLFEKIASYYVLLSWIYDGFNELPYLRLRGDPGCGKTRFLLTVGALCYKPIFASGASTVSPLFRILDTFKGTLIIDEGDFRLSDERAEIVKILNNGNAKGFPVLRTEVSNKKEFNPTAYSVFGPKLIATRSLFEDRALESRCLTEPMGQYRLRTDVPINLPSTYKDEARRLRNKLLLFRFRHLHRVRTDDRLVDRAIEPRLNQVFVPLLSIIEDEGVRAEIRELARRYNGEFIADRGMDTEAHVLDVIKEIFASREAKPSVNVITSRFMERYGEDYERKITPKWIGGIIRKRLNLKTQKSNGVFVIPYSEEPKLVRLYERFGIAPAPQDETLTAPGT